MALQTQKTLDVHDGFQFRTQVQACNTLVDARYSRLQQSTAFPWPLKAKYGKKYEIWFPKAELVGHAVSQGWHNILSEDGATLFEYNESWDAIGEPTGQERIVFIQTRDPAIRQQGCRFVGIFK